ncbi:Hsp60 family chaperonin [Candidatus Vidania fulgoroideorum]
MYNKIISKNLYNGKIFRKKILKGINKVCNYVKTTLGPTGSNVVIEKHFGSPVITKDGVTIAKEIVLKNKLENIGAQLIKEIADKTDDIAGDGTTTATVLSQTIINECYKNILLGYNSFKIQKELKKITKIILMRLKKMSKKINNNSEILHIASLSANDSEIGKIIAKAISKIGKNSNISIENGKFSYNELEIVKGFSFEKGYISHFFLKENKNKIILKNSYILLCEKKINNFNAILPVLEKISKQNLTLLIVVNSIDNDILNTIILNNARNIIKTVVVKIPGYGDNKENIIEDICLLTGCKTIKSYNKKIKFDFLGKAKKIEIKKNLTTIIKGNYNKKKLKEKINNLNKAVTKAASEYDVQKIKERISKLSGGIAVIKVGGNTETEIKEKKYRIQDAINSTKAALEAGVIPGGGIAFLKIAEWLKKKIKPNKINIGFKILLKALYSPFIQILKNSGEEYKIILNKILKKPSCTGYDVKKKKFCNFYKVGIIDSAKVLKTAFKNAVSVSVLLLNTTHAIVNK